jgi:hypothetical protein
MAVVLVVEDEEQIRVLVESILVDDGHQTLSAAATAQALAVIQTDHPIDLLFTDIRLGPDVPARLSWRGACWAKAGVARMLPRATGERPFHVHSPVRHLSARRFISFVPAL